MGLAKTLPPIDVAAAERFHNLVDRRGPDDCWPFLGGLCNGYGYFRLRKRKVRAHRVAWVLWSGQPEPDVSLQLDHACHNPDVCRHGYCPHRACCNPAHLRSVTPKQNTANSWHITKQKLERPTCPNGHPWNVENTRVDPRTGNRLCRPCQRENNLRCKPLKGKRLDFYTHCVHGHEWKPDTTRHDRRGGWRICCLCHGGKPNDRPDHLTTIRSAA